MVPIPRHPLRRRPRPQRRKRPASRRRWLLALAALAMAAIFWLWPAAEVKVPPPEAPPAVAPAKVRTAAVVPKPVPPKPKHKISAPSRPEMPERDKLLAAVRERLPTLRPCAQNGGTLAHLPLRLHVASTGAVRRVDFTGDSPSAAVASCVRKTAMGWSFEQLKLPSDVDLMLAVSFAPGA